MPVSYDSKPIIPGPFVSVSKELVRGEDGKVRRRFFNVVAKGKLMAYAGSPRSDGTWWGGGAATPPPNESVSADRRLASLKNKMGALTALFSNDGRWFEVQPWDGSSPVKCQPIVKGVEFAEGKWVDYVDFTVQMEAANVWFGDVDGGGGFSDLEPEESWAFEVENQNTRTYRVSHTVSSQQKATFGPDGTVVAEGWENAKAVVLKALEKPVPAGVMPPVVLAGPYYSTNYVRTQTADEANGRFSVSESYVCVFGQRYAEEFVVNCRYQEGRSRVTVEGTVTGFGAADFAQDPSAWQAARYAQAAAGWDAVRPLLFQRAQNYSGVTLNPQVLNDQVGLNPVGGVVTYAYEYDDRPPSLVPGSISEALNVSQQNPQDIFAALVVPGKGSGPVLQPINTVGPSVKTVTMEVVVPPWRYSQGTSVPLPPDVAAVVGQFYPAGGFIGKDDEVWQPHSGRYSRVVSWTYVL